MKAFFQGFAHILVTFFTEVWTFVKDHFTDKSGFWDEKRTTAFALMVLAVLYGVFPASIGIVHPDPAIFGGILAAGVAQYFGSAYNDGRNPISIKTAVPGMTIEARNGGE